MVSRSYDSRTFTMPNRHYGVVHFVCFGYLVLNLGLANASALTENFSSEDQTTKDSTLIIDHEYPRSYSLFATETTSDLPENEVSTTSEQHEERLSISNSLHSVAQENIFKNTPSLIEDVFEASQNAEAILKSESRETMDVANSTTEMSNLDIEEISNNLGQNDSKHTTIQVERLDQMAPITSSSAPTDSFSTDSLNDQTIEDITPFDKNVRPEDIEYYEKSYIDGVNIESNVNTSTVFEKSDLDNRVSSTPESSRKLEGATYLALASVSKPESSDTSDLKSKSTAKLELLPNSNNNHSHDNQTYFTDGTTDSVQINQLKEGEILKINQNTGFANFDEENIRSKQKQLEENEDRTILSDTDSSRYPENLPMPEKLYGFFKERYDTESSTEKVLDEKLPRLYNSHYLKNADDENSKADDDYISSELHNTVTNEDSNDLGTLFEDCSDCDIRILPIKPLEQRSTAKTEMESLPSSKITFGDLPEGRELQINSLGLSDGIFLFSYISEFLSWIQPNDFPVELLKEALKNQMTWISLITQSLHVEAGFVACLVVGVLLALAVPVVVLSHACYRMGGRPEDQTEDNGGWAGNCRRRTLVFILQLLLVLLCGGMVAMFVTNEQLSSAVVQSRQVVEVALGDVSTFVHNSHLHLHFLLTQSLDQTLQAVYADLDNVDTLLGRPIQRELVRETGLDVALDTLSDMTKEAKSVTQQVERFMEEVQTTQELLLSSRDKLADLRQQVELFRRACGPRDRTMCDTIDASGLEVTFKLDRIKTDERLNRMRRMGGVGLELAASEAKDHFLTIPSRVEAETRDAREDVRRLLSRQRVEVDEHTLALERLARDLTSKVGEARFQAGYWTQDLDQLEYWRWIVCMGGGAAVLMIWMLLLCSMCCGCCGSEKAAGPTILVTIVLMCLFSTALWTLVMVGLLVGGHTEVFLCRPLYDEPEFRVLSRLVDQPGVFYDQPSGGFIGNVIYGNDTIDVPVTQVLKDCRGGRPVYPALGLHRVMDVASAVGRGSWGDVTSHLRSVRTNLSHLEVLSPALTDQLGDLLATLSVNFTEHRIQMSRPVTGKDLDSFAKQLDNIGNQLRDLATASRMETLSSRTRRLIDSHIRPLEGRKDALVYQLTALEVQTQPLQRQINQSLSHLKTIQFFINSQGQAIGEKKSREYVERLLGYVEQLRDHVTRSARETVAPCRPIWDIFNNSRLFLCHHIVDPLNGFWFATMWCLIVLLVATPVCLKLVDYYRVQGGRSSGSPSQNLVSSEQGGGWSTPGYDIKYSKDHDGGCE